MHPLLLLVGVATLATHAGSAVAAPSEGPPSAVGSAAMACSKSLLPRGAQVRIHSTELGPQPLEGRIICASDDVILLEPKDESGTIRLGWQAILSIELLSSSHPDSQWRSLRGRRVDQGAAIGALALGALGGTVGVLVGLGLQHEAGESGWDGPLLLGAIGAGSGALVGALMGAAVGAVLPAQRPALAVFPLRGGGAGAVVMIRF